jgi:hypothetical protein
MFFLMNLHDMMAFSAAQDLRPSHSTAKYLDAQIEVNSI